MSTAQGTHDTYTQTRMNSNEAKGPCGKKERKQQVIKPVLVFGLAYLPTHRSGQRDLVEFYFQPLAYCSRRCFHVKWNV